MDIEGVKDASEFEIFTDRPDVRRDLHLFAGYVRDRDIKRGHRDNSIGKADARRLAKLFSDPDAEEEVEEDGYASWVDCIDGLARRLGLVHYDTEGTYAGYTSREPCFPDNYIEFDALAYENLTSMNLAAQEKELLDSLLQNNQGCSSEFYLPNFCGRLDHFDSRGCATGVMPLLDFTAIRRFLLDLLSQCPAGEWLSTASLIEYLKKKHRYFLIPKKPEFKEQWDQKRGRYDNFRESPKRESWGDYIAINEIDADAFERVEGRYVERFLEGIPQLLGYVDVAYAKRRPKGVFPPLGFLPAFRVSERLQRALQGKIAEPTLRVTATFEVYVQSEMYSARLLRDLAPICELVSEDTTTVFRLDRQKVAAACAADPRLDVTHLLESLSIDSLPANVHRELADWSAHSEKFILYSVCSLLETDGQEAEVEHYRVENIVRGIDIVRSPESLYAALEKQQLAPLRIKHNEESLSPLPANSRSAFPR